MGGTTHTKGRKQLLTEINMVPFIDVVLVLLIIFMVMSPFLAQSEIDIKLPKVLDPQAGQAENPITIQITKDGDFFMDKARILRKDLSNLIKASLAEGPTRGVLIEADRDVRFKNVVLALDAAEKLKAGKVGVAVLGENPEDDKK